MKRAISHAHPGSFDPSGLPRVVLPHDQRHLRRKLIRTEDGGEVHVDLPAAITLSDGDALVLDDGALVLIVSAEEPLYEITAADRTHLARLCWHLGNRHLPTEIGEHHVRIGRDHVIRDMLLGLGAKVREVLAPFSPERGAYHEHGHGSGHTHHVEAGDDHRHHD